jgi:putative PIN family toxin of toxin-antitoxin system
MTQLYIVDTNVLVAGLISSQKDSPVLAIVDAMLKGAIIYVLSSALIKEYRDVLLRPKLCKIHGLNEDEIDHLLTDIIANAIFCEPPIGLEKAPDLGDNHLWDLLQDNSGSVLITGDKLLLNKPLKDASVIAPSQLELS